MIARLVPGWPPCNFGELLAQRTEYVAEAEAEVGAGAAEQAELVLGPPEFRRFSAEVRFAE
jgi:hypothetical protein